jgi:hypothetical protein
MWHCFKFTHGWFRPTKIKFFVTRPVFCFAFVPGKMLLACVKTAAYLQLWSLMFFIQNMKL